MPEVSVIVPIYNCEEYLKECLDSILSQSFEDFELILVDDGSPDRCGMIVDEYASADARIKAIHTENRGQSAARNRGLDEAKGKYVYISDSDDILSPNLLETVLNRFEPEIEMVAFCFDMIPKNITPDKSLVTVLSVDRKVKLSSDEEKYEFLTGPFRRKAIRWEVWNRIYRRDIIEKWNIRFPDDRRLYPEDMYFNYCYVAHISNILMIPDVLYTYRLREGSASDNLKKNLMIITSNLLAEFLYEHYKSSEDCSYLSEHYLPIYYLLHKGAIRRLRRYHWKLRIGFKDARTILAENVVDYMAFRDKMVKAYGDPTVIDSYRKDNGRILQLVDRLYTEEVLEFPRTKGHILLRRMLLDISELVFREKI